MRQRNRRCSRRDEGRRMPQGRNEEIRKGGIEIGKEKKKKEKKERKRMRGKRREDREQPGNRYIR